MDPDDIRKASGGRKGYYDAYDEYVNWLKASTAQDSSRQKYIDDLTNKMIADQLNVMTGVTTNSRAYPTTMHIDDSLNVEKLEKLVKKISGEEEETVEKTAENIFDMKDTAVIINLKDAASKAFRNMFGMSCSQIVVDNVVMAGGAFVSWMHHGQPADIDMFVLDDELAKEELRRIFTRVGFKQKDSEYMKNSNPGAAQVQEVWEDIVGTSGFQFIFTGYKTREELMANFDFKHCMTSFHKFKLYITRTTFDSMRDKELVVNNEETIMPWRIEKFRTRGFVESNDGIMARAMNNVRKKSSSNPLTGQAWIQARTNPIKTGGWLNPGP